MSPDPHGHVSRLVVACALEREDLVDRIDLDDVAGGPCREVVAGMKARRARGDAAGREIMLASEPAWRNLILELAEGDWIVASFDRYLREMRRLAVDVRLRHALANGGVEAEVLRRELERLESDEEADAAIAALGIVPAGRFADVEELSAEPLLGTADEVVLPAGGGIVFFGKGGAGKTTAELDLVVHLAAGVDWLGLPAPRRCRVLVIENEGPRGMFRRKLRAKLNAWDGPSVDRHLFVLEEPWARFTFDDDALRAQLVEAVREHEVDVVAAGPVHRLGIKGGGTPEEVAAFAALIESVRAELERPLGYVLVHHDNKAGAVSGAWEGVPDTLCHVRSTGNGATRLEWEKARWAGRLHGTAWALLWREGESFERDEQPEVTDEDIRADVLAVVEANPGCSANKLEKAVGHHATRVREVRDELLEAGELVNNTGASGRRGGGMALYLAGGANLVQTLDEVPDEVRSPPREEKPRPASTRKGRTQVDEVRRGRASQDERCPTCELPITQREAGEPFCRCEDGAS